MSISGEYLLLGERRDAIDHTPEDEDVRLKVGEAFDLRGEHKITRYDRNRALNYEDRDIEIRLRNHKDEDIEVRVVEHLFRWSEWKILESSHVIAVVPPFAGGRRAELTKMPKVFFIDNGIRNQLFGGFAPARGRNDRGVLMENLVFCELAKNLNPLLDSLRYWCSKSRAEVRPWARFPPTPRIRK